MRSGTFLLAHSIVLSASDVLALLLAALLLGGTSLAHADTQFSMTWARKWQDDHFASGTGNASGFGLAIDSLGDIYISGATCEGDSAPNYGFLAKFDSEFNEIWYQRDYITPVEDWWTGVHRVVVAPDGNLIVHATAMEGGEAYARVMKVSATDGSIIWQTDLARGNDWASIWDGAAGPALDSEGNIYIASALGEHPVANNGEPLGIYKLNGDGNLLWSRTDYLCDDYSDAQGWDDVWEIVVDSEGSVYISASAGMTAASGALNFGLVKYDAEGNHVWTRVKDWGYAFDAPRGLAIDEYDNLYQSGNVGRGEGQDWQAGVWKLDKEGNIVGEAALAQKVVYPYGSLIDAQGNLILHGIYQPGISEFNLYSPDLELLSSFEYQFPGCSSWDTQTRGALDPWGNAYLMQVFHDDEYGYNSIGIIKIPIPEPSTWVLVFLGLAGLAGLRRRNRVLRVAKQSISR